VVRFVNSKRPASGRREGQMLSDQLVGWFGSVPVAPPGRSDVSRRDGEGRVRRGGLRRGQRGDGMGVGGDGDALAGVRFQPTITYL
jgi:hypothetical protein